MDTIAEEVTTNAGDDNSPSSPIAEKELTTVEEALHEKVYAPATLSARIIESYMFRTDIIIKAITSALKTSKDPAHRETLAKSLKDATLIQLEIEKIRASAPETLAFIKSEIRRCSVAKKDCVDINDIYDRNCNICKSSDTLYTTDIRSLAKEFVRVRRIVEKFEPSLKHDLH